MKILVLAACLSIAAVLTAGAQTTAPQPQPQPQPPVIVMSGEGVVKQAPDRAWVTIAAESRARTAADAQKVNTDAMTAVQQKIAAFSIPKDAIKTTAVDLQLEFDYANGKQTPRGYVARNTVEVRVDDLARLGDVLDAVVASGATTIHGLRFDVKQREQIEATALQAAVKNATAKAQAIAAGASRAVDRIIRIEEVSSGGHVPMMKNFAMARAGADASTPVEAGELEIRAQVRLSVAIK